MDHSVASRSLLLLSLPESGKHALLAVRRVQAVTRKINEMSSNLIHYQCGLSAQCAIGATRCDDPCENTVLLETQGPCGSARRCRDDTVTHDTKCTSEGFTTSQCHVAASAPILLRPPASSSHVGASVHDSLAFLLSIACTGPSHTPSFSSSHSSLDAHSSHRTFLDCCKSIFFTSCGHTALMSTSTSSSNLKECHCGHVMPRSSVSHLAAPAGPLTCIYSLTPSHVFPGLLLLFPPLQSVSPALACPQAGCRRPVLPHTLAGTKPINNFLTSTFMSFFSWLQIP